jgi:hypothetical protein
MYRFAYDSNQLALLGIQVGPPATAQDYGRTVASIEELVRDANMRAGIAAMLIIVKNDDVPDPTWRKRFAEAECQAKRLCRALVTQDPVMLGVGTAIAWVGPQTGIERAAFASIDEAAIWIESRCGRGMPVFSRLLGQVS